MKTNDKSIFYLHLLRCIAALAVIVIHVLWPLRLGIGAMPEGEWLAAAGMNSLTRWAVPVFIMITGALLLSDSRPFDCGYYLKRRLLKVVIPFLGWSLIYVIAGVLSQGGWDTDTAIQGVLALPNTPAWYHLWFFYDFIPLYFVIPFFAILLKKLNEEHFKLLLFAWGVLTLMHWLKVDSVLRENLVLYSGYLLLGWYLFNRNSQQELKYWCLAGISMLLLNFLGTWYIGVTEEDYSPFFMGYKSLNTAVIAGMLFVLAKHYGEKITGRLRAFITQVSKYSLGIYLMHPLLLIPVRQVSNGFYDFFGSNWLAIPVLSFITLLFSLILTMFLSRVPLFKQLVP